jgi:hypothetical protein
MSVVVVAISLRSCSNVATPIAARFAVTETKRELKFRSKVDGRAGGLYISGESSHMATACVLARAVPIEFQAAIWETPILAAAESNSDIFRLRSVAMSVLGHSGK